jgi:hypothetical protein
MDGRMDGWTDGWTGGWVDGWIGGWSGGLMIKVDTGEQNDCSAAVRQNQRTLEASKTTI